MRSAALNIILGEVTSESEHETKLVSATTPL